jgi:glucose-6-phosphate isomerase
MQFNYEHTGIAPERIVPFQEQLEPYRELLEKESKDSGYKEYESLLQLPADEELLTAVKAIAQAIKTPTLQYIVVNGIGGSNLGTNAVYEAIAGSMHHLVDRLPKLLFLDTVSDERMTAVCSRLMRMPEPEDFAVISISKSGSTVETIANTEALMLHLKEHFHDVRHRFAVITQEGSKLWTVAGESKFHRISMPETIVGRFSVFSAVGLLPLYMANIDIDELRAGARQAIKDGVSTALEENHPMTNAILTYLHGKDGRNIHNSFVFSPKMESLGKWYRQLMGESIGKEKDLDGNVVNTGITPIVSVGSTDLHSMAQLYYGGPDDKFTNLVFSFKGDIHHIPNNLTLPGLVKDLAGKSLEDLMHAIVDGVISAYKEKKRPFVTMDMEGISTRELGYYLQFRMIEVMYLAKLMNVNAFDQPAVELYKHGMRESMQKRRLK